MDFSSFFHCKDGEAVVFDETSIHRAENRTDVPRITLFCDIERPLSNRLARAINRYVRQPFAHAAATQNVEGEAVGVLDRLFGYVYRFRLLGKKVKAWNLPKPDLRDRCRSGFSPTLAPLLLPHR